MLSLKDIEEASFRKAGMKGYHTEDVDEFLDEVRDSYEKLLNDNGVLKSKLSEALEKNRAMASEMTSMKTKMDAYRSDGDEIKHALISAHKMADATIRDANARAAEIVAAAQKTVDEKLGGLDAQVQAKEAELETMKQMVSDFRKHIFDMYKEHLAMIDQIPVYTKKEAPVEAPVQAEPAAAPVQEEEVLPVVEEAPAAPAVVEEPVQEEVKEDAFSFRSFMVDSSDFQPGSRPKRQDLKFGDEYDISKDN